MTLDPISESPRCKALLGGQLKKLSEWNQLRYRSAMILSEKLRKLRLVRLALPPNNLRHGWYKYYCYLNLEALSSNWNRLRIIQEISNMGFPAYVRL